jgi:hypothetical protein
MEDTNRSKSLSWWRCMNLDQQYDMAKKHYPGWHFNLISASPTSIERMYIKEMINSSPKLN